MPVSIIDPHVALVTIDLQNGIVASAPAEAAKAVIANASLLADAFRARQKTVVLVNVTGGAPGRVEQSRPTGDSPADWSDLVRDLNAGEGDLRVSKKTWGAFTNTDLHARLQSLGITQIVLCGISTSIGVESAARQAYELGYNVVLVTDAMTDTNADAHANSLARIFPRLGETGTTREIIGLIG